MGFNKKNGYASRKRHAFWVRIKDNLGPFGKTSLNFALRNLLYHKKFKKSYAGSIVKQLFYIFLQKNEKEGGNLSYG